MYRNKTDIGSKELYQSYRKGLDSIEKDTGYDLPRMVINKAVHEVNRKIVQRMIDHNFIFKMPYKLGTIIILKNKPKVRMMPNGRLNLPIDMHATQQLWKEQPETRKVKYIYHRNLHSGGYVASFKWKKTGADVKNIFGYGFHAVKGVKRELGRAMKDPLRKVDFYEK